MEHNLFPLIVSFFILIHLPASACYSEDKYYINCSRSSKCGNISTYELTGSSSVISYNATARPNITRSSSSPSTSSSPNITGPSSSPSTSSSPNIRGPSSSPSTSSSPIITGPSPSPSTSSSPIITGSSSSPITSSSPNITGPSSSPITSSSSNITGPSSSPNITGPSSSPNIGVKLAIGTSAAVASSMVLVVLCFLRREGILYKSMIFWRKKTKNDLGVDAFIRDNGSLLALKQYRYSDVKKMTKSFTEKLGQGGYGCVYKGKLLDGRLVAVKVLNESKGNGEEFLNEVASISRTSHVNVVTLFGFCYERTKRALIYEFMPNGSLDQFIYIGKSSNTDSQLEWKTLYRIAVGIARGLEYLHNGCNTRILHFDIKPHNILLDEEFCPKISDFGLAKLCQRKESIISMLGARGTAGYIAPEVFSRHFGGVSYKSDVYSYGMMVLEVVGGRRNIEPGVSRISEIYFPHWIFKYLEPASTELRLNRVITEEEEEELARKMILVGLWCIQTKPSDRPSMTKVVEMLEGSIQSIQIPPKPFLCSPPRSPPP